MLAAALERLERGEIDRLLVQMPPRNGKSMMTSQFFPAWYLGRNPDHYVISTTYGQDLADDFGRQVRDQLADPLFGLIFPGIGLAPGGRAASRFVVNDTGLAGGYEHNLNRAGAYYGVGVGGPVTGRGAHLLLVDDPIKNREEADSEVVRASLKSWYTSTAYTRLMPGGRILVIQTRWQEDDLSGWLELEHAHEGWTIIRMPAIADSPDDPLGREIGEPLWPEMFDLAALARIKLAIGARDWSALYQQRPAPDEGLHFLDSHFLHLEPPPSSEMRIFGASDYAVTENDGDYTVHMVFGLDRNDNLWILDLWRAQAESGAWVNAWISLVRSWGPIYWGDEGGVIYRAMQGALKTACARAGVMTTRMQITSTVDKLARARTVLAIASNYGIRIPRGAPWWADLIAELKAFPAGKHDDQVDTLSLAGQMVANLAGKGWAPAPLHGEVNAPPPGSIPASVLIPGQDHSRGRIRI